MAIIQDNIPNFIGGVSQQPAKLMFQNSSKELINYIPSPTQGLIKRPPTEYKHLLMSQTFTKYPKIHVINNENGVFYVVLDGTTLKVFNADGTEATPTIESSTIGDLTEFPEGVYEVKKANNTIGYTKVIGITNNKCTSTVYSNVLCTQAVTGDYYYTGYYYSVTDYQAKIQYSSTAVSDTNYEIMFWNVSLQEILSTNADNTYELSDTVITDTLEIVYDNGTVGTITNYLNIDPADFIENAVLTEYPKSRNQRTTKYTGKVTKVGSRTSLGSNIVIHNPTTYIQTLNPLVELDCTTIGNYTFILNKTKTTAMLSQLPYHPYKNALLVFVKQADYAITHTIEVDGKKATYTSHASDNTKVKTDIIRENLVKQLKTQLGSKWHNTYTIKEKGSCFVVYKNDNSEMTVSVTDSNGNRNVCGFYNKADALENLPLVAPNNFVLKVTGEGASSDDDYYVRFMTSDGTNFSNGNWEECGSPDLPYMLDSRTMPHILEYTSNGFIFKAGDYTGRRCGDEESAKTPSFIGNTIQEVFAHKGRIGFLSNDKSIYSDTEDVFAFFKKTTLTKLDTDPIDLGSNSKLALLKHSLQYNTDLLLFSPTSVFQIKGGDVFSNSTVTMDMLMEYPCSPVCKPIAIGDNGLYVSNKGNYSTVYELYLDSYATVNSRKITEAIPTYIPKNVYKIAGNIQNNIACLLTTEEPDSIYIYNFYYNDEQKAQSAWCKWNFGETKIFYADFIDSNLILFTYFNNQLHLEIMDCSPKQTDEDLNFNICLDKKIKLTGVYDSEEDNTTYTLPYSGTEDVVIIDTNGFSHYYTKTNNSLTVDGDVGDVYVGVPYLSTWTLPTIYKKQPTQTGNQKTVEGLLMLKDINLSYADTGYFRVKVIPHFTALQQSNYDYASVFTQNDYEQAPQEFENQNNMLGTPSATLGVVSVHDGTMLIPIMMKNEEVTIQIVNDSYLPCCFNSLLWLGNLCIRGQKS